MLRGGSIDRSGASPRLPEELRKHHEAELSSADRIQEVPGTHKRQPSCPGIDPGAHNGEGPGGIGKGAVSKGLFNDTDNRSCCRNDMQPH